MQVTLVRDREPCPCGCGGFLPEPITDLHEEAGTIIEKWLGDQGMSLEDLRSKEDGANVSSMVEVRRRVSRFLHDHHWTLTRIGRFLNRDHSTIHHLLNRNSNGD